MKTNKIYRTLPDNIQLTGRKVSGMAIVFEQWSNDLGGFIEKINRESLDWKTVKKSDIIANMDHRTDYIMARSRHNNKGNLHLELREEGLYFEFDAPKTVKGDELLSHIERGEYSSCSFCFSIDPEGQKCYNIDGVMHREIVKISALHDVAIVAYPAYEGTSVEMRSKNMIELFNTLDEMEKQINKIYEQAN